MVTAVPVRGPRPSFRAPWFPDTLQLLMKRASLAQQGSFRERVPAARALCEVWCGRAEQLTLLHNLCWF